MSFRAARPSDIPLGLGAEKSAYDLWGRAVWPKGKRARTFGEQRSALAHNLWIWEGDGDPDSLPADEALSDRDLPVDQLEALHDRLRVLREEPALPDNFPDIIWNGAACIQRLCASASDVCMAYLLMSSHPGNALLNCLHVAFVCELAGIRLGWSASTRQEIICAALTMNWTIIDMQDSLSQQGKGPSAADRLVILNHPAAIERLLKSCGVENPIWLACCKQHHEEPDGKGYPDKLVARELCPEVHLLRCADRYVALVASRAHRFGLTSPEAISQLYEQRRSFEPIIVDSISLAIGAIAPGSVVKLPDGDLARVMGAQSSGFLRVMLSDGSLQSELPSACSPRCASHEMPSLDSMERVRRMPV